MPHLIIEYSQQQAAPERVEAMLNAVHLAAVQTALFDEGHIRVRAAAYSCYRSGGGNGHFIHA